MLEKSIFLNNHFSELKKSYDLVGQRTWNYNDFLEDSLKLSTNLFTKTSLIKKSPKPKKLEVIALLSGLSFSSILQEKIIDVQNLLFNIINKKLSYWVKPLNLGVEYCVFKWPDQKWNEDWERIVLDEMENLKLRSYNLFIQGLQINKDGCVILKCYDESSSLFEIRNHMTNNIFFTPKRQSNWAHIPIGRILEPVGDSSFHALRKYVKDSINKLTHIEKIESIKLIHEKRWYMEERKLIKEMFFR